MYHIDECTPGRGGGGMVILYGLVVVARTRHSCGLPRVNLKNPHRTASIFYMYTLCGLNTMVS